MGIRKRKKIKFRAKIKRKKRRAKLKTAGKNPDEVFYSGIYLANEAK